MNVMAAFLLNRQPPDISKSVRVELNSQTVKGLCSKQVLLYVNVTAEIIQNYVSGIVFSTKVLRAVLP